MITIEDATREQLPVVQKLAYRIWPGTFNGILSDAQISYMLDRMYSASALEEQCRSGHQFILAKADDRYVGYAAFEMLPSDEEVKLHKIYVLPAMQGRGVGKALISEIAGRMALSGRHILLLNVNRYNRAVSFYEKIGFKIIGEEDNAIGKGFFMNDYVMKLNE
jgi:ribosomal protein S18 acetylase RimI-like enzyme